jgi:putative PIN family toxin of toxin-antitoxin system
MIAVVLDTNVLATGFLSRETPPGQLIDAWQTGLFHLVTSEHIITELTRTLAKEYFSQRLTAEQRARAVTLLRAEATVTPIIATVSGVATHPEDDLILETAVSGKAAYLVTGDMQLRKLGSFKRVTILSPADFLETVTTSYGEVA